MDEWFEADLFEAAAGWVSGALADSPLASRSTPRRLKWKRRHRLTEEEEKENEKILAKVRAAERKR